MAEAIAQMDGSNKAVVYCQLLLCKAQRETGRKMCAVLEKTLKGGINRVEIIAKDGSTKENITKSGIEWACLDENDRKYRQTQHTPCMSNPLCQLLGLLSDL